MQCDELEVDMPPVPRLNELDSALQDLGMLSSCVKDRQDYMNRKQKPKLNVLNMLSINTRYVSNVSIGFRVRPVAPHARYKPYSLPKREERHRTRSENNDNGESTAIVKEVLSETVTKTFDEICQLKRAKSLENIALEDDNHEVFKIPELEIVSNCIEKLRVVE